MKSDMYKLLNSNEFQEEEHINYDLCDGNGLLCSVAKSENKNTSK